MMGNKCGTINIVDTTYVCVRESLSLTFQEVLVPKPPHSLFPWKTVSHLPIGYNKALHSTTFSKTPKNLVQSIRSLEGLPGTEFWIERNHTPPRTRDNLLVAFNRLRAALVTWKVDDNHVNKPT